MSTRISIAILLLLLYAGAIQAQSNAPDQKIGQGKQSSAKKSLANSPVAPGKGGGAAGKVAQGDIAFTKKTDQPSPVLGSSTGQPQQGANKGDATIKIGDSRTEAGSNQTTKIGAAKTESVSNQAIQIGTSQKALKGNGSPRSGKAIGAKVWTGQGNAVQPNQDAVNSDPAGLPGTKSGRGTALQSQIRLGTNAVQSGGKQATTLAKGKGGGGSTPGSKSGITQTNNQRVRTTVQLPPPGAILKKKPVPPHQP